MNHTSRPVILGDVGYPASSVGPVVLPVMSPGKIQELSVLEGLLLVWRVAWEPVVVRVNGSSQEQVHVGPYRAEQFFAGFVVAATDDVSADCVAGDVHAGLVAISAVMNPSGICMLQGYEHA